MGTFGGPDIITDGLVLALDAGSTRSYPGTGTTWSDLSGDENNSALVNGVGFSTDNGGTLTFDGADDYAQVDSSTSLIVDTRTVEIIFRMDGAYSDFAPLAIYANGSSSTNRIWLGLQSSKFQMHGWGTTDPSATTTISSNQFYICTFSFSKASEQMKMYTNGQLETTMTNTQGGVYAAANMNWYLATVPGGWQSQTYSNVDISSFKMYNRILTDAEVLQNYNAQKNRFI
jgi:hypothetical protein